MRERASGRNAFAARSAGFLVALGCWGWVACGDLKSPTDPGGPGNPGATPAFSFERIQTQVFTPRCASPFCHAAGTSPSGLVLEGGTSYSHLVGVRAVGNPAYLRVAPGDADRSYLIRKLRGEGDAGDRMPLDGPPYLTAEEIAGIAAWIQAGAPRS